MNPDLPQVQPYLRIAPKVKITCQMRPPIPGIGWCVWLRNNFFHLNTNVLAFVQNKFDHLE